MAQFVDQYCGQGFRLVLIAKSWIVVAAPPVIYAQCPKTGATDEIHGPETRRKVRQPLCRHEPGGAEFVECRGHLVLLCHGFRQAVFKDHCDASKSNRSLGLPPRGASM